MQRLYMTQPYYAVPNGYFVAKRSKYLSSRKISTARRSARAQDCSHELYLKGRPDVPSVQITLNVKDPKIVAFETEAPGLVAADEGEIDAFLAADPVGSGAHRGGRGAEGASEVDLHVLPVGLRHT